MSYKEFMELRNSNAPKITLAGIEFYGKELDELMEKDERYIIKYRSVYYLEVANYIKDGNPSYKVRKVYRETGNVPLTKAGRFVTMDYKGVNNLLGQELFAY